MLGDHRPHILVENFLILRPISQYVGGDDKSGPFDAFQKE